MAGYWAYGGDFGETRHDTNFCCNGIMNPDLSPKPALAEIKHCYAPHTIGAIDISRGAIRIHNGHDFTDLSQLRGRWQLAVDGTVVQQGELPYLDTAPGVSDDLHLLLSLPSVQPGQEAWLTVSLHQRQATNWCDADHCVQQEQFAMPVVQASAAPSLLFAQDFTAMSDKKSWQLASQLSSHVGDWLISEAECQYKRTNAQTMPVRPC